jgi:hypothetical protein
MSILDQIRIQRLSLHCCAGVPGHDSSGPDIPLRCGQNGFEFALWRVRTQVVQTVA